MWYTTIITCLPSSSPGIPIGVHRWSARGSRQFAAISADQAQAEVQASSADTTRRATNDTEGGRTTTVSRVSFGVRSILRTHPVRGGTSSAERSSKRLSRFHGAPCRDCSRLTLALCAYSRLDSVLSCLSYLLLLSWSLSHACPTVPPVCSALRASSSFVMNAQDVELMEWCQGLGQMETTPDPNTREDISEFHAGDEALSQTRGSDTRPTQALAGRRSSRCIARSLCA